MFFLVHCSLFRLCLFILWIDFTLSSHYQDGTKNSICICYTWHEDFDMHLLYTYTVYVFHGTYLYLYRTNYIVHCEEL